MKPRVIEYQVPVRAAAPQAIATALGLGWLYGKAISGDNGAVRYGWPSMSTNRNKYAGYVFPPQIFTGYSARRVAGGSIRVANPAMPTTNAPVTTLSSPLVRAMATVGGAQMGGA